MLPLTVWLLACAASLAAQSPPAEPPSRWPVSAWAWSGDEDGGCPGGAWPIGNGRVFAYEGPGPRANTLHGLTGPHYGTPAWGTLDCALVVGGREEALPAPSLAYVRGAPLVRSEDRGARLALRTVDGVPQGGTVLVRWIEVVATGDRPVEDVVLRVRWEGPGVVAGEAGLRGVRGPHEAFAGCAGAQATGHGLELGLGRVAPDRPARAAVVWGTGTAAAPMEADRAEAVLRSVSRAWYERRLGTVTFDAGDPHLRDLLDAGAHVLLSQQDRATGLVLPMCGSRRTDPVACTGSLLGLLRYGFHDEADALLAALGRAARRRGHVPRVLALPDRAGGGSSTEPEVAEPAAAARVVLQHFWAWRAHGDLERVRAHWDLLEACLANQPERHDDLEAAVARAMAVQAMAVLRDAVAGRDDPRDPDRPGIAGLRHYATLSRRIDERFWSEELGCFTSGPAASAAPRPAAEAALRMPWLGHYPTGGRHPRHLRAALATHARALTSARPSLVLDALTEARDRTRGTLLQALLRSAAPAGSWSSGHAPADPAVTGRRLDALVHGLTGIRTTARGAPDRRLLRLNLHLPAAWSWFEALRIGRDGWRVDLFVDRCRRELTPAERRERRGHPGIAALDPGATVEVLHFAVELLTPEPPRGVWQLSAEAMGTSFQRWLTRDDPVDELELVGPLPQPLWPEGRAVHLGTRITSTSSTGSAASPDRGLPR